MPHQPPRWIVSLIALGVVVGGAIAASGAEGDDPVLEDPVPTTLVTTTTVADDAGDDAPEGDEPTDDGVGTERYWGEECGDGEPTNHGQYVASSERNGESRRAAAQSPCGKPLQSVDVTPTTAASEEELEGGDAPAPQPAGPGNGNGSGNAGGNGRGGPKNG